MDFKEFQKRVGDFVMNDPELNAKYDDVQYSDNSINGSTEWFAEFYRGKVNMLSILYDGNFYELNEIFERWDEIPESYGLKPRHEHDNTPMFIYGQYKRLGDALNALKKGDSKDGRKYKELYW